jgi:hypothetical protein
MLASLGGVVVHCMARHPNYNLSFIFPRYVITVLMQPANPQNQWRAVHGSKGSIASVVKKRKEKNSYINNSI